MENHWDSIKAICVVRKNNTKNANDDIDVSLQQEKNNNIVFKIQLDSIEFNSIKR